MSYNYSNGDGLNALDTSRPDGASEKIAILDDAIRQIKLYLADPSVGPDALARSAVPTGAFFMWPGSTAPSGFLLCNGQAVSSGDYPDLYDFLTSAGSPFGTDGGGDPLVPDMARRVPVGAGGAASSELGNTVGDKGGEEEHTLTESEMPEHRHETAEYYPGTGSVGGNSMILGNGSSSQSYSSDYNLIATAGGDAAHNNMQPSLVTNFIIKT